jgi:hypothetical protein
MRPILALLFLSLALAARPGEVLVLPFLGLPPGEVEVASDLPLLLTPSPGEGPFLVVVEVPKEVPPGLYRVCLRPRGGTEVCQKVEVEAIRDLEARVPREVYGGSLRLLLRNRGNVTERVHLAQAEGSEVGVNPLGLTLAPGEEREVALSLSGFGLLKLALLFGEKRALYLVQVLPEGGSPLPYALQGRLEGSLGQGPPAFRLSLEGPLSREVGVGFLGGTDALRLALRTGPWSGRLSLLPALEGGMTYREGPHALSLAYPWALEWTYTPGETYRLRLSPTSLALGYADGTYAFGANFPWSLYGGFPPPGALRGALPLRPLRRGALRGPGLGRVAGRGGVRPGGAFPADGPHGHPLRSHLRPSRRVRRRAGAGLRPGLPPFPLHPLLSGEPPAPGLLWPRPGVPGGSAFGKPGPEPGEGASLPGVAGGPLRPEAGRAVRWGLSPGAFRELRLLPPRARTRHPGPGRVRGGAGGGAGGGPGEAGSGCPGRGEEGPGGHRCRGALPPLRPPGGGGPADRPAPRPPGPAGGGPGPPRGRPLPGGPHPGGGGAPQVRGPGPGGLPGGGSGGVRGLREPGGGAPGGLPGGARGP